MQDKIQPVTKGGQPSPESNFLFNKIADSVPECGGEPHPAPGGDCSQSLGLPDEEAPRLVYGGKV
jgi:hypothetical protein